MSKVIPAFPDFDAAKAAVEFASEGTKLEVAEFLNRDATRAAEAVEGTVPESLRVQIPRPRTLLGMTVEVDGNARVVRRSTEAPVAGEVSIDVATGVLRFNAADEGEPFVATVAGLDTVVTGEWLAWLQEHVRQTQEALGELSLDWDSIEDKPSTFPPEAHTHPAADISDSTETGRAVMTAADAAALLALLGFTAPILDKASPGDIGQTTPAKMRATELRAGGMQIIPQEGGGDALLWLLQRSVGSPTDWLEVSTNPAGDELEVSPGSQPTRSLLGRNATGRRWEGYFNDVDATGDGNFGGDIGANGRAHLNKSELVGSANFSLVLAGVDPTAILNGQPVGISLQEDAQFAYRLTATSTPNTTHAPNMPFAALRFDCGDSRGITKNISFEDADSNEHTISIQGGIITAWDVDPL